MNIGDVIETIGALQRGLRKDPTGTTVSVRARRHLDSIDGYVVGGSGVPTLELPQATDPLSEIIFDSPNCWGALTQWLMALPFGTHYVGAWLNDGIYYIDAVDIYRNLSVALSQAEARGELAIYDGFRQQSLSVAEPQH